MDMYGVGTGGGRSGVRVQDKQDKLKETLSNTQDKAKKKKNMFLKITFYS